MLKLKIMILLIISIPLLNIIAQETKNYEQLIDQLKNNLLFMQEQLSNSNNEIINLKQHLKKAKNYNMELMQNLQTALLEQRNLKILIEQSKKELQIAYELLESSNNTIEQNNAQFEIDKNKLRENILSDKNKSFIKGLFIGMGIGATAIIVICIFK